MNKGKTSTAKWMLQVKLHYIIRFEFDIRLEFLFDSKLEVFVRIRFELKKSHSHTPKFSYNLPYFHTM